MARNINIAVDCTACCAPLAARLGSKGRAGFATKVGFSVLSSSPKRYKTLTLGGYAREYGYIESNCSTLIFQSRFDYAATVNIDELGTLVSIVGDNTRTVECCPAEAPETSVQDFRGIMVNAYSYAPTAAGASFVPSGEASAEQSMTITSCSNGRRLGRFQTATLSNEVSDAEVFAIGEHVHDLQPAWPPGYFAPVNLGRDGGIGTAGLAASRITTGPLFSLQDLRYYPGFDFRAGTTLARGTWIVRTVPQAGVALSSVEVKAPGRYRPAVTVPAPPSGGTQAHLVALMAADGSVSAWRILNPGAGYLAAPVPVVAPAINGGTTATCMLTIDSLGRVVTAAGGGGNYLPQITLDAPLSGGTQASASATLRPDGGIDAVTLDVAGSAYQACTAAITSRTPSASSATLLVHLGTETPHCLRWDGKTPAGRWYRREIGPAGESISSLEVVETPYALPTLSVSKAFGSDGRGAGLTIKISSMSPAGAIEGITILDGGRDYSPASPPIIRAAPAAMFDGTGFNGDASFSVTVDSNPGSPTYRQVTGVAVTNGGDYLPRIVISPYSRPISGAPKALGTCAMGPDGALSSFAISTPSSGFGHSVRLDVRYAGQPDEIRGSLLGVVHVHYGDETEFTDLTRPPDPDVWPLGFEAGSSPFLLLGAPDGTGYYKYFEIEAPAEGDEGIITVVDYQIFEDTAACPP